MDQTEGSIGIKIYNASPQVDPTPYPPQPPPQDLPTTTAATGGGGGGGGGRRRQAISKGVQKTLSKTSMLVNFLPTGTLLTFEMLLPTIYAKGECSHVTIFMIHSLLLLCTLSCFFFHFTDSFRGPDGKLYYGFVTPKGLAVFKKGLDVEVPKDPRYQAGLTDFVNAFMSVLVFVAIAFSDHRVTNCLFPKHTKELDEVMQSFPLMVSVVCSGLFLIFPSNARYGIGCMSA